VVVKEGRANNTGCSTNNDDACTPNKFFSCTFKINTNNVTILIVMIGASPKVMSIVPIYLTDLTIYIYALFIYFL
jgi:hypothetical protein